MGLPKLSRLLILFYSNTFSKNGREKYFPRSKVKAGMFWPYPKCIKYSQKDKEGSEGNSYLHI